MDMERFLGELRKAYTDRLMKKEEKPSPKISEAAAMVKAAEEALKAKAQAEPAKEEANISPKHELEYEIQKDNESQNGDYTDRCACSPRGRSGGLGVLGRRV